MIGCPPASRRAGRQCPLEAAHSPQTGVVIIFRMHQETDARGVLTSIASGLCTVVDGAWQAYLDEGIPRRNRTTRANIVNDYMHDLMSENVPEASATLAPRSDKPFYEFGGYAIRLKQLRRGRPSNVATKAQSTIEEQLSLDLSSLDVGPEQLAIDGLEADVVDPPRPPYISVGYELDPTESEIDTISAVLWHRGKLEWRIDLRDLAAGAGGVEGNGPTATINPVAPAGPELPTIATKPSSGELERLDLRDLPHPDVGRKEAVQERHDATNVAGPGE